MKACIYPARIMPTIILASQSPRRRDLLESVGLSFTVEPAEIDEQVLPNESPSTYARRLAETKAALVSERHSRVPFVLGADTTVSLGQTILGKPSDALEAKSMLRELSGKTHLVTTGYALATPGGRISSGYVETKVQFRELSTAEIEWYVGTGEPFDKAGGYGIQGRAAFFVSRVDGSVSNVIGLPLAEVVMLFRLFGLPVATVGAP